VTLTSVLEAIVEPHRREIVDVLSRGERPVGELADRLGLSQPSASKHLRVLRDAAHGVSIACGARR
jgi:DNA-binding transcriptional ArsR family regulator